MEAFRGKGDGFRGCLYEGNVLFIWGLWGYRRPVAMCEVQKCTERVLELCREQRNGHFCLCSDCVLEKSALG